MRQRTYKSLSIVFWFGLSCIWLWAGSKSQAGQTLLLDDFETLDSVKRWEGDIQLSKGRSSHGQYSAMVRLEQGRSQISSNKLPQDWRGYDRLLFDIYCDREEVSAITRYKNHCRQRLVYRAAGRSSGRGT